MGERVAVYGGYGHTGRFVVAELRERGFKPIPAGRDADKLVAAHPGLDTRQAPVDDPAALDRALRGVAAVINCAGPFAVTSAPVIEAAGRAGIPYVDVAAEIEANADTFARFAGTDAVVVPAMAFFGGLGDLLVTAALGDRTSADEVRVAYGLSNWHPTEGTVAAGAVSSARRNGRRVRFANGRLEYHDDAVSTLDWPFPEPMGTRQVIGEFTMADVVTIPSHVAVPEVRTYMAVEAARGLSGGVTERDRSDQTFLVDVLVRTGGASRRIVATGRDIRAARGGGGRADPVRADEGDRGGRAGADLRRRRLPARVVAAAGGGVARVADRRHPGVVTTPEADSYTVLSVKSILVWAALILGVGAGVTTWLVLGNAGRDTEVNRIRLDAIRTAGSIVVGTGGAAALLLAARRQRSTEIALRQRDREQAAAAQAFALQERVAADTREDAAARRITDLYTKAVELLGSAQAPVRLGGLYALERLAQDNPGQRQTIINVLCACLRMPADLSDEDDLPEGMTAATYRERLQEREFRLTAQRLLTAHLCPDTPGFWRGIDLDLTAATLTGFSLHRCAARSVIFKSATFTGYADFSAATFTGPADLSGTTFTGGVTFGSATFHRDADFEWATFTDHANFESTTFTTADFEWSTFTDGANFEAAHFTAPANFGSTTFTDGVDFERATFTEATFAAATFTGYADFRSATFTTADFTATTFTTNADFEDTTFTTADFRNATFDRGRPSGLSAFLDE
ncbi:hypothetical protein LV75_005079 [Actinokineospora diospyrosa]|uniref:Saccharopine dehydrogenase NADP binding domain-containing protein n=3 Tax=Actinokineospora diospyrosa TaxID=103728 RepID=A0ABT1IJ37_9PSEU|nr:hypothetical protein [Actinokineospora diospyrosa]